MAATELTAADSDFATEWNLFSSLLFSSLLFSSLLLDKRTNYWPVAVLNGFDDPINTAD